MKPIAELLRHLSRPEVSELALASGRNPSVKSNGAYQPVDAAIPTAADVLRALNAVVGSERAATLADKPMQWNVRVEGVSLSVAAMKRGDMINVRLTRGAEAAAPAAAPVAAKPAAPAAPVAAKPAAAPVPAPVARPLARPATPITGNARDLAALLQQARGERASDVHLVSGRPLLFRLGGELRPRGEIYSAETVEALVRPHVPERLLEVLEREGSCDFALDFAADGRFRVNVSRQRTGLKACFRLIPLEIPTLASLGLPPEIEKAVHHHQGLIVVTGPSGHGKTNTLAAILDIINSHTAHHVLTVEDPIEFMHPRKKAMMSQREVGTHTKTFASALKGSLREDPDVIVVGELRDTETVRMALAASETGHLLVSTMNTPSAAKTIDRLIDLFPPADQGQVRISLSTGLRLIVSQRLVPTADGQGLVAAVEILPGSIALGNLIRDNKTFQIPSLQQRGKALGIIRFEDSLAELVRSGKTTLEHAKVFADNPDELEAVVSGKRQPATLPPPDALSEGAGKMMSKMGSVFGKKGA